MLINNSEHST